MSYDSSSYAKLAAQSKCTQDQNSAGPATMSSLLPC